MKLSFPIRIYIIALIFRIIPVFVFGRGITRKTRIFYSKQIEKALSALICARQRPILKLSGN